MSEDDTLKRRYREFLDLLPLTLAIAGLPPASEGRNFTTEQMDFRAQVVANAFKVARRLAREVVSGGN